jgi:hypothetical protein
LLLVLDVVHAYRAEPSVGLPAAELLARWVAAPRGPARPTFKRGFRQLRREADAFGSRDEWTAADTLRSADAQKAAADLAQIASRVCSVAMNSRLRYETLYGGDVDPSSIDLPHCGPGVVQTSSELKRERELFRRQTRYLEHALASIGRLLKDAAR